MQTNITSNSSTEKSAIGRESQHNYIQSDITEVWADADIDRNKINRRIHKLEDFNNKIDYGVKKTEETNIEENRGYKNKRLADVSCGMKWHRRLGHRSVIYLQELKKILDELKKVYFDPEEIKNCDVCKQAKMKRKPYTEVRQRADRPMQELHSDIIGPFKVALYPGSFKYIITFTDEYTWNSILYETKE